MADLFTPFIRSDLTWNGTLPNNNSLMISPDIIPFDIETLDPQTLKSTYKSYINQPLRSGVANNIYLRCASQFDGTLPDPLPNMYLYYSTNNLIAWPDYWQTKMIGSAIQAQNIDPEQPPLWSK
jgi:hypothetical protein